MIEVNLSLLTISSQMFVTGLIVWALMSNTALSLPKWQRFLMSISAAILCAQTALMISALGEQGLNASNWTAFVKDLSIAVLALLPLVVLFDGRRLPNARTSRTSPPSGPHPDA